MTMIFLRNKVAAAGGSDAYAIGGTSPELVASFLTQDDATTEGEYFRKAEVDTTFAGLFTFTRASSAWYFNSSGVLTEATSGNARRDAYYYNGTAWVKGGLQIESAAATNLVANSTPATAEMNLTGVTITENALNSPLGTNQAFLMTENSATSEHRIQEKTVISWVAGTTYCAWAIVKPNGRDWCYIRFISPVAPSNDRAYFNLTTGSVGAKGAAIDEHGMIPLGNGYYIVWATCTAGTTAARFWILGLSNADNGLSYLGDGSSGLYVAHMQVEADAAFPSSPIVTNGSTVTRAAETLSIAGTDTPANITAMSISMTGAMTYVDEGVAGQETFLRWYADANNYITLDLDTDSTATGEVNANQSAAGTLDTVAAGAEYNPGFNVAFNIASRHTSGAINVAKDGTAATADTTPTALADLSSAALTPAYDFAGFVAELRVFGADIGDTGIEDVTT